MSTTHQQASDSGRTGAIMKVARIDVIGWVVLLVSVIDLML